MFCIFGSFIFSGVRNSFSARVFVFFLFLSTEYHPGERRYNMYVLGLDGGIERSHIFMCMGVAHILLACSHLNLQYTENLTDVRFAARYKTDLSSICKCIYVCYCFLVTWREMEAGLLSEHTWACPRCSRRAVRCGTRSETELRGRTAPYTSISGNVKPFGRTYGYPNYLVHFRTDCYVASASVPCLSRRLPLKRMPLCSVPGIL